MNTFKSLSLLGISLATFNLANAQFTINDEIAFSASVNAVFNSDFPGTSTGLIDFQEGDNAIVNVFASENSGLNTGGFGDYFQPTITSGNPLTGGTTVPGTPVQFNDLDYKNFTTPVVVWEAIDSVTPGVGNTIRFTLNDLSYSEEDSNGSITIVQVEGTGFISIVNSDSVVIDTIPATFLLNGSGTIADNLFTDATWSANNVVVPEPSAYAAILGCVSLGLIFFFRKRNRP